MNEELITNWTEHDRSLQKIIALAEKTLCIFDEDLTQMKLEQSDSTAILQRFLGSDRDHRLQIVVRDAGPFRTNSPRLWTLLETHPDNMTVFECPPSLASLSDALLIADDRHALVRFHKDHPRAKAIIDNPSECGRYRLRFEEILRECGEPIGTTTLGL